MIEKLKLLFRSWKYKHLEDPAEISYLLRTIRPGDAVFDIGAHKGGYTYWMKKAAGRKGKVYAFEPQPLGAGLLRKLFHPANVVVEALALSNAIGKQEFFIMPQPFNVSFEASLENKYGNAITLSAETITIDAYCFENAVRPAFMKIDVEGHELQVLQGGRQTLTDYHPALLIEIEERHIGKEKMQSIFSFLQNLGYQGWFFYKGKKLPLAEFDISLHQSVDMLKKDHKLYINNFVFEIS
jgi:FkbM family methyltransferase